MMVTFGTAYLVTKCTLTLTAVLLLFQKDRSKRSYIDRENQLRTQKKTIVGSGRVKLLERSPDNSLLPAHGDL